MGDDLQQFFYREMEEQSLYFPEDELAYYDDSSAGLEVESYDP